MASYKNHIEEARESLEKHLASLDEDRKQIMSAIAGLGGKVTRRGPGRPRGAGAPKAPKASGKKRRSRRGGTRAEQAVKLIEGAPGIGASDVAKQMKIKPNYLYRVLGDLEKEGRVKKQGRQYYPAG